MYRAQQTAVVSACKHSGERRAGQQEPHVQRWARGTGRTARADVLPQPLEGTHRDRAEWGCTGAKESTGDRIMWAELRFRVTEGERNV